MKENSKLTMMAIIAPLGICGITSSVAVGTANHDYRRLYRNAESRWIITKEDLEQEENTFAKSTGRRNLIEFEKTDYSVKNLGLITGLESVRYTSMNSYLL